MVIGEDKSKVYNIVKDNIQHFRILYSNILRDCPQVVYKPQQGKLEVKYVANTHTNTQRQGHSMSFFVVVQRTLFFVVEFNILDIQDHFNMITVVLLPFVRLLSKMSASFN